jgi:Lar family restriction alleviation protein
VAEPASEELQPCPFCGSDIVGVLEESTRPGDVLGRVSCGVCGADGPRLCERDEFVRRWNQRRGTRP